MKRFCPLSLLIFCFGCRHSSSPQLEKEWQSLLDQKEYFKLRESMTLRKDEVSPEKNLYFRAFIDNVFNMNAASIEDVKVLRETYGADLSDTVKARLLQLDEDNYFKTFQYAKAAQAEDELIDHYPHAVDNATLADTKNTAIISHGLVKTPPQETHFSGDVLLPWTKNKVGLMQIPGRTSPASLLLMPGNSVSGC